MQVMKILLLILLTYFSLKNINSQDPHFTQFYNSPLYLNSAFTGANINYRINLVGRNQWWNIPGMYNTLLFSIDYYMHKYKSATGLLIISDLAGSMNYGINYFSLLYSYKVKLNYKWSVNLGVKPSIGYSKIDQNKLIFGDQIIRNSPTSMTTLPQMVKMFFDFGFGAVLYAWHHSIGISFEHINRPNYSFLQNVAKLPIKVVFHAKRTFFFNKSARLNKRINEPVLVALLQYKFQEKFDQFDISLIRKTPNYLVGVGYRGIPFLKAYKKGYPNNDALIFIIGYTFKNFEITYSYDFTVSWLTYKTGGSNEISITYLFKYDEQEKRKLPKVIPCPKYQ